MPEQAASSTHKYFRAKDECTIRTHLPDPSTGKNADKAEVKVAKGRVIEASDFGEVGGRVYIKFAGGANLGMENHAATLLITLSARCC